MQSRVITVKPKTTLPEAMKLSAERGVRHLPVVDGAELVGIVSDRDLKRAMASSATSLERHELTYLLEKLNVEEIMTRPVVTIGPIFPVEEAARLMVKEKISALPVTEGGRLIGIVTETDVLELFVRAMGAGEPSSRLDIVVKDRPSALSEIVELVESHAAPILSVVTLKNRAGFKEAVLRVGTINPGAAIKALEAKGYAVRESWRG
jgi:acetoin utilization protein AcuB